jgi:hypothetical protein
MRKRSWSCQQVWEAVRAGTYVAYRHHSGQHWEWRLRASRAPAGALDGGPAYD